jgi:GT2 family glycosyltransferase
VVTTVDRPEALRRCLEGLLAGEMVPEEIVVADQGDTGVCENEVLCRQKTGVRMRYFRQERLGLSAARNAAAAIASGAIIAVTDDDCVPDHVWVQTLYETLSGENAPDAVTGRVLPLGPEMAGLYAVSSRLSTDRQEFVRPVHPWKVGTGANFAVRRDWLERIGGYDERLGAGSPGKAAEDMDLLYRLLLCGAKIRYEPEAVVMHERQTLSRRRASRHTYGFGIGAFCGIRLRLMDLRIIPVLGRWVLLRLRLLFRAAWSRDVRQVQEESTILQATGTGFAAFLFRPPRRQPLSYWRIRS